VAKITLASRTPLPLALLRATRPRQWTKNLLLYLALAFSINQAWEPSDLGQAGRLLGTASIGFVLFCALAGAVYLLNDIQDVEKDRAHPTKRERPIAAGTLPLPVAWSALVVLAVLGLAFGYRLGLGFGLAATTYVAIEVAYSYWLKHVVLLDVFAIAAGFVLRAVAGALAIHVVISPWLYLVAFLGALFIAFTKRRQELLTLEEQAPDHRPILQEYSPQLIDALLGVVTASTLIAYSLYTFSAEGLPKNHALMLTIPFLAYGIFRYYYLVHTRNLGAAPEEVLLKDWPLLVDILLWLATTMIVLVAFPRA